MTKQNWKDWFHNTRLFIAPVLIMYITGVIGVVGAEGHVLSLNDLIPSTFTRGWMALYVLNSILDWARKWNGSNN